MLKPRREMRPVTRDSTPGLFSTRTDRMCFIVVASLLVGARVVECWPRPSACRSPSRCADAAHGRRRCAPMTSSSARRREPPWDRRSGRAKWPRPAGRAPLQASMRVERGVDVLGLLHALAPASRRRRPASRSRGWRQAAWRSSARRRTASATGAPCRAQRLSMMSTFTGTPLMAAVAISWQFIWNEPSPATQTTWSPGSRSRRRWPPGSRSPWCPGRRDEMNVRGVLAVDVLVRPHLVLARPRW